ncbi:hypothetical protein [Paraburkholderia hospita]|uniref:hypothetical protein n=1 Tax=Paraburkholderia hospita TaxID=169430 RepID=UPI000B348DE9|nr:hypothetical protein [Paraburkholderia hospita]OUL88684.1 hypothetical protein CA601_18125 [Paraburkholderia hospita]
MKWKKLGRLYSADPIHPKLLSHAANPLPILLADDVFRIFFSGRDAENKSSVGFVDIDIVTKKIINVSDRPVFEYGPAGSYYSHGVSIGNGYEVEGEKYILFMGWHFPVGQHWRGEIGRLKLNSDYSLTLDGESPMMPLNDQDPLSLSYPCVIRDVDGLYQMWYGSTATWDAGNGEMLHTLCRATSIDGKEWQRQGLAIPFELGPAQAFSHPTVLGNLREGYQMWFSYRGNSGPKYRIGYATSVDGSTWVSQNNNAGIDMSESGWDSEMIAYPSVFRHKDQIFMLYTGNSYGKTGFGLAIFE